MRAGGCDLAIATSRLDTDRNATASGDRVAGNFQVAAAPGFQPPVFRRNKNCRHARAFNMVAGDFTVAGLDENAARAVETELTIFDRESIADAIRRTNHAAHRQVFRAIQRDRVSLGQRTLRSFQTGVHILS